MSPVAGSVGGRAVRLRTPARAAAAFNVTADRWALVAGGCLIIDALVSGVPAAGQAGWFDEAAIHALGLGLATTLIVGMAHLLAPVFALARATSDGGRRSLRAIWLFLSLATASRVAGALLEGTVPADLSLLLVGLSGLLTLVGLGTFAARFAWAWVQQAGRRGRLRGAAMEHAAGATSRAVLMDTVEKVH